LPNHETQRPHHSRNTMVNSRGGTSNYGRRKERTLRTETRSRSHNKKPKTKEGRLFRGRETCISTSTNSNRAVKRPSARSRTTSPRKSTYLVSGSSRSQHTKATPVDTTYVTLHQCTGRTSQQASWLSDQDHHLSSGSFPPTACTTPAAPPLPPPPPPDAEDSRLRSAMLSPPSTSAGFLDLKEAPSPSFFWAKQKPPILSDARKTPLQTEFLPKATVAAITVSTASKDKTLQFSPEHIGMKQTMRPRPQQLQKAHGAPSLSSSLPVQFSRSKARNMSPRILAELPRELETSKGRCLPLRKPVCPTLIIFNGEHDDDNNDALSSPSSRSCPVATANEKQLDESKGGNRRKSMKTEANGMKAKSTAESGKIIIFDGAFRGWTYSSRPEIRLADLTAVDFLGMGHFGHVKCVRWQQQGRGIADGNCYGATRTGNNGFNDSKGSKVIEKEREFATSLSASRGSGDSLKQFFALKIMERERFKNQLVASGRSEEYYVFNEREIMIDLDSPFHVRLLNTYKSSKNLYMLLEYAPGRNLKDQIDRELGLTMCGDLRDSRNNSNWDDHTTKATHQHQSLQAQRDSPCRPHDTTAALGRIKFYAASIVLALRHLHQRQIMHRDIKPSNLLIDARGCVWSRKQQNRILLVVYICTYDDPPRYLKVCDFGFARWMPVGDKTRSIAGTYNYLTPEQAVDGAYDHSVDLW
jgi:hypothetical protein